MTKQDFHNFRSKTVEELFLIGRCYENGDGVGKDKAEAVKWYRTAARCGSSDAMFELSKCYTFGIGVRRNRTTASKWLRNAAESGHVKAMCQLGNNCLFEYGNEYNPRKAVRLFQKAAEKGDSWGMFYLGECYEDGIGIKKDFDAAFLWFCRAVCTSPEDDRLYQSVQNRIFDPNLNEYRENIINTSNTFE